MQDTSGVHVWLVLAKAFHALAAHAEESLNLSRAGLGDSDFRVLEALLHKGPLPVNTIGPKVAVRQSRLEHGASRPHPSRGLQGEPSRNRWGFNATGAATKVRLTSRSASEGRKPAGIINATNVANGGAAIIAFGISELDGFGSLAGGRVKPPYQYGGMG
jgi:hypothetical protein